MISDDIALRQEKSQKVVVQQNNSIRFPAQKLKNKFI